MLSIMKEIVCFSRKLGEFEFEVGRDMEFECFYLLIGDKSINIRDLL